MKVRELGIPWVLKIILFSKLNKLLRCDSEKIYIIAAFAGDCLRRILLTIAGLTSLVGYQNTYLTRK